MTTDSLLRIDNNPFRGKDLLGIADLNVDQLKLILEVAAVLKRRWQSRDGRRWQRQLAEDKAVLINLEKPSFRTATSCQLAIQQLGGHAVPASQPLKRGREPLVDLAGCSDRFFQGVVARTFEHDALVSLARHLGNASAINGLSSRVEHPLQALADALTIIERCQAQGKELKDIKVAYVGDGNNNVFHSLAIALGLLGLRLSIGCPEGDGMKPDGALLERAVAAAEANGGEVTLYHSAREAVDRADFLYMDTFVSMGDEDHREKRLALLHPFQVTPELLSGAADTVECLHCLPAHHGEEVSKKVVAKSAWWNTVYLQAENRLHTTKAVFALFLPDLPDLED